MGQEVIFRTWCDVCADESEGVREPAESVHVQIGNDSKGLDLCERHDKMILGPVRDAMAAHGLRTTAGPPRPTRERHRTDKPASPTACLWCPETFGSPGPFAGHLVKAHGFPRTGVHGADVAGIFGGRCPYCGAEALRPSSFGIHIKTNHPGLPTTMGGSFVKAKAMGDPHGIVAPVERLAPNGRYRKPRARRSS